MNLVVDIGNTRVKYALFKDNKLIKNNSAESLSNEELNKLFAENDPIDNAIVSTVKESELPDYLKMKLPDTVILSATTALPVKNEYKTKNTLGFDRIAAAAGALQLYPGKNTLIIDAGTTITIDFMDSKGTYKGGNISPGINMRFDALHSSTSKLPRVNRKDDFMEFGDTTDEAILSGVLRGVILEIDSYISFMRSNYKNIIVLITGGDANFFDKKLKNTIFVVSELVSIGLNSILEYNVRHK